MLCVSHPLALALKQAYEGQYQPQQLIQILSSIEADLDQYDLSNIPLDFISSLIHNLYLVNNTSVRGYLLRLIASIENEAPTSIIEAFHFDKLIAFSFDHRLQEQQPKDEEKISAIRNVSLLLKIRKRIPESILRALIAYQTQNKGMKPLIITFLCESAMFNPQQLLSIPEIGQLIIDDLIEKGNSNVCGLINYAIEKGHKYVHQKSLIPHLITPFATFQPTENLNDLENPINAVCNILQTWPGLLHCGFRLGLIKDLINCLPHNLDAIVLIFKKLLVLDNQTTIFDSYSGLLLFGMTKYGLINKLHTVAQTNVATSSFLNSLLPFLTMDENSVDLMPTASHTSKLLKQKSDSMAFHLSRNDPKAQSITTVKEFTLESNILKWNWGGILKLLTVILPHNEIEAKMPESIALYRKLLGYYASDDFISKTSTDTKESLIALIRILTSGHCSSDDLYNNKNFAAKLKKAAEKINQNEEPLWSLYKSMTILMKTENGTKYLQRYKIADTLKAIGESCTDTNLVTEVLDHIDIIEDNCIGKQIVISLLNSSNQEIHKIAVNKIKSYQNTSINFPVDVFQKVVIPYTKEANASENSLKLFVDLVTHDSKCLDIAVVNKELFTLIQNSSRFVYSLLFSRDIGFEIGNIEYELNWWLECGIDKYVKEYDKALLEHSVIPPHLFGQLCKTEKGRVIAETHLKSIRDRMDTKKKLVESRGAMLALAHYGSIPSTNVTKSLAKIKVLEKMFKYAISSTSLMYKGTFLAALSMMTQSRYLSDKLEEYSWQIFRFGSHTAVLPFDLFDFIGYLEPASMTLQQFSNSFHSNIMLNETDDKKNDLEKIIKSLLQLSSPITQKQARADLQQIFQTKSDLFIKPELALTAHEMLSKFTINPDNRFIISKLFFKTPLVKYESPEIDQEAFAIIKSKLFHVLETINPITISDVVLKKYPLKELKTAKIYKNCPEVYLSDEDFKLATGKERKDFYNLSEEEMNKIRESILS
ncbi:hypothetical protein TRFO_38445 [Tritrichomonas foetus]|uniref:Uncharacterized protein n=1 Tax=Tritrichomonas foetus TaxID=1144522 RepID=A0A1J4JB53_9EUKA|nr:hypothetical protein TRFO_38445 [Tritrichomonas foetus]|eukprot:OHS95463.1 hypothetical protein TRFO_38445 [Tritrichomonas foetus]